MRARSSRPRNPELDYNNFLIGIVIMVILDRRLPNFLRCTLLPFGAIPLPYSVEYESSISEIFLKILRSHRFLVYTEGLIGIGMRIPIPITKFPYRPGLIPCCTDTVTFRG